MRQEGRNFLLDITVSFWIPLSLGYHFSSERPGFLSILVGDNGT